MLSIQGQFYMGYPSYPSYSHQITGSSTVADRIESVLVDIDSEPPNLATLECDFDISSVSNALLSDGKVELQLCNGAEQRFYKITVDQKEGIIVKRASGNVFNWLIESLTRPHYISTNAQEIKEKLMSLEGSALLSQIYSEFCLQQKETDADLKKLIANLFEKNQISPAVGKRLLLEWVLKWKKNSEDLNKVAELVGILIENTTELNLQNMNITCIGVWYLAEALKKNRSLTTLNLASNSIGDLGAGYWATTLKENHTLRTLNLASNSIGDPGAGYLSLALKENHTLTTLSLASNSIGDPGAGYLVSPAKSLSANKFNDFQEKSHIKNSQ